MGKHAHMQGMVVWVTGMCRMDHRAHMLSGEMPRACRMFAPKEGSALSP